MPSEALLLSASSECNDVVVGIRGRTRRDDLYRCCAHFSLYKKSFFRPCFGRLNAKVVGLGRGLVDVRLCGWVASAKGLDESPNDRSSDSIVRDRSGCSAYREGLGFRGDRLELPYQPEGKAGGEEYTGASKDYHVGLLCGGGYC